MKTFADKIIAFNKSLRFTDPLPDGIRMMNPFLENETALPISTQFYKKFYNDTHRRHLILGINPGRFGAGLTGVPFTDTKRLKNCGIPYSGKESHEPSSVFIYEMIDAFGGPVKFYRHFYIHSICPLGLVRVNEKGKEVNYNYYDSKALTEAVYPFILENMRKQLKMDVFTDTCFCLGTGANEKFLCKLNGEHQFFGEIIALEHPRFVMQYKAKTMQVYIDKDVSAFRSVL